MKLSSGISSILALAVATDLVNAGHPIHDKISDEQRLVVFNSRRLTGECLPICVEEPQILSTQAPTKSPTKSPTPSPTDSPTKSPTKNPTPSPTDAPTKSPTKNPTPAPTEDVVQFAPPYTGTCPAFTESFDGQVCGKFMEPSALWFTSGVNVKAIGGNTPNANGVHIAEGGFPLVECAGGGQQLTVDGSGPSTLVFTFNEPTYVNKVETTGACPDLTVYYSTGGTDTYDLSQSSSVLAADVEKMEVGCTSSGGAVTQLDYMFCPPEGCPLKTLDFSSVVKGQWITDELKDNYYVTIAAKKTNTGKTHKAFTPIKSGGTYATVDAGCNIEENGKCEDWNEGALRVFDTAEPQCWYNSAWRGGDTDLGAPNIEFGGRGRGCGGGKYYMKKKNNGKSFEGENENTIYNRQKSWDPPARDNCMFVQSFHGDPAPTIDKRAINPWVNDQEQGHVLIIQENDPKTSNVMGPFNNGNVCPDDTGKGGFMIFRFEKPVSLQSLELLDTDEGNTPEAHIKYCDGTWNTGSRNSSPGAPYKTPKTGDNGFAQVDIQDENVCELWMKYFGSGSFSKLKYGVCPDPDEEPEELPQILQTASPTKSPTKSPTPEPTLTQLEQEIAACPVPLMAECVHDVECLGRLDGIGIEFGCPKCVAGKCMERKIPNGNVNCCKRTPGNDLVITNGCGANNICFGFRDHDQCEVNQHAAYCHNQCYNGNIGENMDLAPDFSRCKDMNGNPTTIGNDQGSKPVTKIYPMKYCMTRDIKWKNGITGQWDENPPLDTGSTPVLPDVMPERTCDSPPAEMECDDWQDCVDYYGDTMACPKCRKTGNAVKGVCEDAYTGNGNLNCCKITPGTGGIVTNGCGANNICWGFNQHDQCEVNQHAAYCHPRCPDGNMDSHGNIDTTRCDLMNDQGSKWDTPIYPMQWCMDRDIKHQGQDFEAWFEENGIFESESYVLPVNNPSPTPNPTSPVPAPTCKAKNVGCGGDGECCSGWCKNSGKCN